MKSVSDETLAADCTAAGHRISANRVRRFRELGYLPRPEVQHLGRGKGTVSAYPRGTAAIVSAILTALKAVPNRDLSLAALSAWASGAPIPDPGLRKAFHRSYLALGAMADNGQVVGPKPAFFGPPGPEDALIAATVLAVVGNRPAPDGGLASVFTGLGLEPAAQAARLVVNGEASPELHAAMDNAALVVLDAAVAGASRSELDTSRDRCRKVLAALGNDDPLAVAMAAPLMLPIVRMAAGPA